MNFYKFTLPTATVVVVAATLLEAHDVLIQQRAVTDAAELAETPVKEISKASAVRRLAASREMDALTPIGHQAALAQINELADTSAYILTAQLVASYD